MLVFFCWFLSSSRGIVPDFLTAFLLLLLFLQKEKEELERQEMARNTVAQLNAVLDTIDSSASAPVQATSSQSEPHSASKE